MREAAGQDIEGALSGNCTGTFKGFRSKDMFKNVYFITMPYNIYIMYTVLHLSTIIVFEKIPSFSLLSV